jgi:cob(I)alamin adenosyltransferase
VSIETKTGDDGTTALMYGRRVSKTDPRVVANGGIDELNSALGVARAAAGDPALGREVMAIQKELVIVMGEIAVFSEDRERYAKGGFHFVEASTVDRLTGLIDELEATEKIRYDGWATPGGTPPAAAFDVARGVCRRAEREVVAAIEQGFSINPEIIRYLNRLSDLCWLWARWIETRAGL